MKLFIKIALFICIVLIALIFWRYYSNKGEHKTVLPSQLNTADNYISEDGQPGENNAVGIAVKGIILSQGESGNELWRLNATSASLDQKTGRVIVTDPNITYFMQEEEQKLNVISQKGYVQQSEGLVKLWGDVRVTESDNLLTTNKAEYDTNTHLLILPEKLDFLNPMFAGSANNAKWNLDTNIIEAQGDVHVIISSKKKNQD